MSQPIVDWDSFYKQDTPPPYSIGAPQPELAALIERGEVRSEVLDAGCGHAALSVALAERGHTVVGFDLSPTAVAAAAATAAERDLTTASFETVDMTAFTGYDGRFSTVLDSGLLHALPVDHRQPYVRAIHRAAAPGAGLFVLAFSRGVRDENDHGPNGFTADELHDALATRWVVDEVRPASLYANDTHGKHAPASLPEAERDDDGRIRMPGFLLSAHKEADRG